MVVSCACRRAQKASGEGAGRKLQQDRSGGAAASVSTRRRWPSLNQASSSAPSSSGRPPSGWYAGYPSATNAVAHRCTMPVCRTRSRTCHPGQVATLASGPACSAAAASDRPSWSRVSTNSGISMRRVCRTEWARGAADACRVTWRGSLPTARRADMAAVGAGGGQGEAPAGRGRPAGAVCRGRRRAVASRRNAPWASAGRSSPWASGETRGHCPLRSHVWINGRSPWVVPARSRRPL